MNMLPAKGALLIFGHRVNNMVLNRCRKPADADILVPGDTICLIGTTSSKVPFDEVDNMLVTAKEVDILLRKEKSFLRYWRRHVFFVLMRECVHWWHPMMILAGVVSVVVLFYWIMPCVMVWKVL